MKNKLIQYIIHRKEKNLVLLYKEIIDMKLIDSKDDYIDNNKIYEYIESLKAILIQNNVIIIDNDLKNKIVIFKK